MAGRSPASLAILTHARQGLDEGYFLAKIARFHWRPEGRAVVVHQGLETPPPAALAILHVDVTRVPDAYRALAAGYGRCLNAGVADISKRRVADGLVLPGDGYDGPVVVKTDLNHQGLAERRLALADRGRPGRLLARLGDRLPARWTGRLPGGDYRIYDRPAAVPRWVWRRPELVVQRFFAQQRGAQFMINQWFFLGAAGVVSTLLSSQRLVKMANAEGMLPLHDEVPEEIRRRRAELGFDYGKFDYVVEGDRAWLLDANHTPHLGADPRETERRHAVYRILAGGLEGLDSARPRA